MNLLKISWNYLRSRQLNTLLSLLLTVFGTGTITVLLLLQQQLENKLLNDAKGIDLVVGAKGSPIQMILCNIFQIDNPTGNIKLKEARFVMKNRLVKKAIPLALGDNYEGYRIIGTNYDYATQYKLQLAEGKLWEKTMDVTLGSEVAKRTNLQIGDTFASSHGLSAGSEDVHENARYKVVGIAKPAGTVLDRLILTHIESVWQVHEGHNATPDTAREITSLLVTFKSPMAAVSLPRLINSQTNMLAASPAFETVKLLSNIGVGLDALQIFAYLVVGMAVLSVFIALFNALKERRYDLAVMRMLGASPGRLFVLIITEGLLIVVLGTLLGMALGHLALQFIQQALEKQQNIQLGGMAFVPQEIWLLVLAPVLGFVAAVLPAFSAYRLDIARILAKE
jgi:putative ABC transport system permease protein